MWIVCLADDSRFTWNVKTCFLLKIKKKSKLPSALVVIGALRVKLFFLWWVLTLHVNHLFGRQFTCTWNISNQDLFSMKSKKKKIQILLGALRVNPFILGKSKVVIMLYLCQSVLSSLALWINCVVWCTEMFYRPVNSISVIFGQRS